MKMHTRTHERQLLSSVLSGHGTEREIEEIVLVKVGSEKHGRSSPT